MIHQLRIYEIFEHNKAAFHERFSRHALRIWQPYGFKLVATWEAQNEERTEFIYLLEWPLIIYRGCIKQIYCCVATWM